MKKLLLLFLFSAQLTLSAAVNPEGKFNWNGSNVKKINNGILYAKFERSKPRLMKMAAVRVDLTTPGLRFKITPRAKNWGQPMPDYQPKKSRPMRYIRTERITCRKFMENAIKNGENMVVAVNASPWSPFEPPWTHRYADNQGLMVADGVLVSYPVGKRPTFLVRKDGSCDFGVFQKDDDISQIKHAISGFGFVLKKGELTSKNDKALAPRTGYGLSADRRYLYIFVVDGRQQKYSMGASHYEVGEMLRYLGADDGLNMDGGGSTTLFVRPRKKLEKLNHYINNSERAVGGAMGIIIDRKKHKVSK